MIELDQLSHSFGPVKAVDGVTFRVEPGQIVGFLGANGAGKSTVLRILSTYLPADSGTARVAGIDVTRDPLRARSAVGYLTEHNALLDGMRVAEFLLFMGRMRGQGGVALTSRLEELSSELELETVWHKRIRECSKGFRQRVGLAAALVHDPPVLLLDEPTHGLDPLQVAALREQLHRLRPGRAILFSSHVLAEVAQIASRLLLLQHGRLVLDASVAELEETSQQRGLSLEELVLERLAGSDEDAPATATAPEAGQ